MSGSPVYVDGKLSAPWPTRSRSARSRSRGSRPIADMIEAARSAGPARGVDPPASRRAGAPRGAARPRVGGGGAAAAAARASARRLPRRAALPSGVAGATLSPVALPLVFSGFDADTFDWARGVFSAMGFAPVMGGRRRRPRPGPLPDLAPGAAVGVSLVEGDLDLSVTGTVTHIDGDRVYAFGHPFYNLGPTRSP